MVELSDAEAVVEVVEPDSGVSWIADRRLGPADIPIGIVGAENSAVGGREHRLDADAIVVGVKDDRVLVRVNVARKSGGVFGEPV